MGYAQTVYEPTGTIASVGYPDGYTSSAAESWKFRVPGAFFYTITFTDVDLDQDGCYDYLVIYDDSDYLAPGKTICDLPSAPIKIDSSKITITFNTASAFAAGKRGAGFRFVYTTNDNAPPPSTSAAFTTTVEPTPPSTIVITSEQPPSPTTTTSGVSVTTTTVANTAPPAGGNFPTDGQDDSQCGNPARQPQITGFDYKAQTAALSQYQISSSNRVVNGEEAIPHSWPWQVGLQGSYGSLYCGGTLVDAEWVVTAAHCAPLIFIGTYGSDQVALGMHDRRGNEASKQLIDVAAVYVHPQYDSPDRSHDVAMVKLKTPAVLNDDVSVACEAHKDWDFPANMQCVVTGWGVTVEGGNQVTDKLQQAPLPLLSDQDCYDLYQEANLDTTPDMQCAGGQGKGACNGDSGGPLNCYVNNRWYHMGIVSFGEASCDTEIASIFARVAELRDFIDGTIAQYS
ncbi:unnamed protein product [Clavelina lepadiformis]|uniref:Peptidase S1 domain-containing protein n=1 Tax=Clavelina lepadiformis TaxID=159417 RepID=A0ABP0F761_CLALP